MKNHSFPDWYISNIEINLFKIDHLKRVLFICTFFPVFLIAIQTEAQTALSVETYLKEEDDTEILKKLIYEHVPTIFIQNSEVKFLEEGFPQKLICDVNSLNILEIENPGFRTVKLLQIDLSTADQKTRIKLSPEILKFFPNLSKILISSNIPLTSQEVSQMVSGYQQGDILLLFQIQNEF